VMWANLFRFVHSTAYPQFILLTTQPAIPRIIPVVGGVYASGAGGAVSRVKQLIAEFAGVAGAA